MYSENEIQETVKLNQGIIVKSTDISFVMYLPPEPRVELYDVYGNQVKEGKVVLASKVGNFSKTLTINQLGRVDTDN